MFSFLKVSGLGLEWLCMIDYGVWRFIVVNYRRYIEFHMGVTAIRPDTWSCVNLCELEMNMTPVHCQAHGRVPLWLMWF